MPAAAHGRTIVQPIEPLHDVGIGEPLQGKGQDDCMQDSATKGQRWTAQRDRLILVWPWPVLALAAAYFLTGRLALLLATPPNYAAAIFPPAGIALAAVLVAGYRICPGIFLGALALSLSISSDIGSSTSWIVDANVALSATLQAAAGAFSAAPFRRVSEGAGQQSRRHPVRGFGRRRELYGRLGVVYRDLVAGRSPSD